MGPREGEIKDSVKL